MICIFLDKYSYHRHHHHHKLSAGAITGITIAVILLLCTTLMVTCVCVRRYCRKRRSSAYTLVHKQHPMIFVVDGGSDNESDFKAGIPTQSTAVEYTDECPVEYTDECPVDYTDNCSVENTPTNSTPPPDSNGKWCTYCHICHSGCCWLNCITSS